MNGPTPLPAGWQCFSWPIGWSPLGPAAPSAETAEGRVPQQFCLAVHTPDMATPGAAVVITFEVRDSRVTLAHISSIGEQVTTHLAAVLSQCSPQEWQEIAVAQIAAYGTGPGATAPPNGSARHKLTGSHLEEVSAVYRRALMQGKPPTRAVQQRFGTSHSTAAKWVGHARKAGLLPKTTKGAAA